MASLKRRGTAQYLCIQRANPPAGIQRLRRFGNSGVANRSGIYARTDESGYVTTLHHQIPEVREPMLSGGALVTGDLRPSPPTSNLMTAMSQGWELRRFDTEFDQLTFWR